MRARRLGLTVSQLPSLDAGGPAVQLAPVAVEDLLLRPSVKHRLPAARAASSAARRSSSPAAAARSVRKSASAWWPSAPRACWWWRIRSRRCMPCWRSSPPCRAKADISGRIADVRDRARIRHCSTRSSPTWCSMPPRSSMCRILERDWDEGVKTNVFGSINVADAAAGAGAAAMVMISTDKAIEPVSMLGATKRLAEMYCRRSTATPPARRRQARHASDLGALRQRARLQRLGGAEVQGADRGRRPGHRHPSGHGALLHDHPRGLRPGHHRGQPRARAASRRATFRSMCSTWASR